MCQDCAPPRLQGFRGGCVWHVLMTCRYSNALPCKLPLQEMFIYDSAGKEIFADHVPQFVRAVLCVPVAH